MKNFLKKLPLILTSLIILSAIDQTWRRSDQKFSNLLLTPDQQGALLMQKKQYAEAAQKFADPLRQAEAAYRAADFKQSAAAYARRNTPEAHYDRANSLVMLGQYTDAIAEYDRALAQKPDWRNALENRHLAQLRHQLKNPPNDGSEGTEGEEKPDQILFDQKAKHSKQETQIVADKAGDDASTQALWLRRVQTRPADFLRAKFTYQLQSQQQPAAPEPPAPPPAQQ